MRKIVIGVLALLLISAAAYYTIFNGSPKQEAKHVVGSWTDLAHAAAPFKGVTVKILGEDLPPLHSLAKLSADLEKQTGIKLEIDFKNHSRVIESVLKGALKNHYEYDIIFVPHKELGRLANTGTMTPLSQFAEDRELRDPTFEPEKEYFQPFWREVGYFGDTWYAVPLYLGGSIVVYRKDLLDSPVEASKFSEKYPGVRLSQPKTLDEWLTLAPFFFRPGDTPPLYGISLLLSDESLWYEWQSMLFAYGGNVLDTKHGWEYGDVVVNSPEAISATETYRRLATFAPPDASSYSWGQGIAKQQAGIPFMTLLQYDVSSEFENPEKTKLAGKFGYFPPRKKDGSCASQLESWVGFIPTSSASPKAAWLVLQWMLGKEIQLQMHLEGNISPRKSTYDDPRVKALPYTGAILESLTCMTPKPTIPEAGAIQDILTRALQDVFTDRQTAKAALDKAAVEIKERLGDKSQLRYPIAQ